MSRQGNYGLIIDRLENNSRVLSPKGANASRDLFRLHSSKRLNKDVSYEDLEKAVDLDKILNKEIIDYDEIISQSNVSGPYRLLERSKSNPEVFVVSQRKERNGDVDVNVDTDAG